MIERQIIIGLIVSDTYIRSLRHSLQLQYFESSTARTLATWCIEFYDEFHESPKQQMSVIYDEKLRQNKIVPEIAEEIEEEILPELSDEFLQEGIQDKALIQKTYDWINERALELHTNRLKELLDKGEISKAQEEIDTYKALAAPDETLFNPSSEDAAERVVAAFNDTNEIVLRYPGKLGKFWNDQMVRGALVGVMAPEKRGKTFLLLDMAMRGIRQKKNVILFQAGDMTEKQQIRRAGIYLTKKSDKDRYIGDLFLPVCDCIHNQMDTCDKPQRVCDFGVFDDLSENEVREISYDDLKDSYLSEKEYIPCSDCKLYQTMSGKWGVPWLKQIRVKNVLEAEEATKAWEKYFGKHKGFRMSTHPNGTLTINKMISIVNSLEVKEDWRPDIILVDYADLLVADSREFRQMQDLIWKGLRRLSQEFDCLVVAPTQTNADAYKRHTLTLQNYSEDKRKFAHVTAMYGLNQDVDGREKKIGILRINEIIKREGSFDIGEQVHVLQRLEIGRPFLGSY
jgi:hypothetical protein